VAGLTDVVQEGLFDAEPETADTIDEPASDSVVVSPSAGDDHPDAAATAAAWHRTGWPPGADVRHERHGDGWVWGSGRGRVTVRFETRDTPPGPVRTFDTDDPDLILL
jgi:DNA polymerase-4